MDSGFDGKEREAEADRFFESRRQNQQYDEVEYIKKENLRLLELISNLKKDGYTYDQSRKRMTVCGSCGEQLKNAKL